MSEKLKQFKIFSSRDNRNISENKNEIQSESDISPVITKLHMLVITSTDSKTSLDIISK